MYKQLLDYIKDKPALYSASSSLFWNDEHISKGMLEAHLNFDVDSASRKYEYITNSVEWILSKFYCKGSNTLLDLGCGPGIYSELFSKAKFNVTGIDFSERSIDYAKKRAISKDLPIEYIYRDYLEIDYKDAFDIVTLIYCDFGVLSPENRKVLLSKIKKALKNDGILILDGFSQHEFIDFSESRTIEYCDQGYWNTKPYMCIQSNYIYLESNNYLEQYVIVTDKNCECYNIWNQAFSVQSLKQELIDAGFTHVDFYDDVTGKPLTSTCNTMCAVAY